MSQNSFTCVFKFRVKSGSRANNHNQFLTYNSSQLTTLLHPFYKAIRGSTHSEPIKSDKKEDFVFRVNVTEVITQKLVHSAYGIYV